MKFTPGNEWSWGYSAQKDENAALILNISDDEGKRYVFTTHYTTADLRTFPQPGQAFCIEDAALLTDFQEGLYASKVVQDEICLPLALNALACARFVKLPRPCGRMFLPFGGGSAIIRGQVVSLYTKDGGVGDVGSVVLRSGAMIRVPLSCICAYRSISLSRSARYA